MRRTADATVVFTVPTNGKWKELQREWGEPYYLVFGFARKGNIKWLVPFQELGIEVTASASGQHLPLARAPLPPYSYSTELGSTDYGVRFSVRNVADDSEVRIDLHANSPSTLADGELVVQPDWPGYGKDKILGTGLRESMRPYANRAGLIGLVLVAAALLSFRIVQGR